MYKTLNVPVTNISDIVFNLNDVLKKNAKEHTGIYLIDNDSPAAVLLSVKDYENMVAKLKELTDERANTILDSLDGNDIEDAFTDMDEIDEPELDADDPLTPIELVDETETSNPIDELASESSHKPMAKDRFVFMTHEEAQKHKRRKLKLPTFEEFTKENIIEEIKPKKGKKSKAKSKK